MDEPVAKSLKLTLHAEAKMIERAIEFAWVVRAVRAPDWITDDPSSPGLQRRFAAVPEFGDRILRVVCFEADNELRIVTALFDRNAKRPT